MSKVLVFSIALNGYQWRYQTLLESHKRYASRFGYDHVTVTKPSLCTLGMEVAWLKIKLILQAMRCGYETILFLDADTRVSMRTPCLKKVLVPGKTIYASKGFSGRINSGVLIIQNSKSAKAFFSKVMETALDPIPVEDDVGWGENGHIIYLAKRCPHFHELDMRWNNNRSTEFPDYIRHYSHGPLYKEYTPPIQHHILAKSYHFVLAITKRVVNLVYAMKDEKPAPLNSFKGSLDRLTEKVIQKYPTYFSLVRQPPSRRKHNKKAQ